jgi:D-lactate dehydrogenase (cytochrome)
MRENILALECVLANGDIVNCGTKAMKNSAGYDLLGLMCGSEGTLGVITSVTVKLNPIPEHVVAAVCVFDTLHQAAETVAALKFQNVPLIRCELLDSASISAFNKHTQSQKQDGNSNNHNTPPMQESPTLFLELHGSSEAALKDQIQNVQEICVEAGGTKFQVSTEAQERQALWKARHALYYVIWGLRPGAESAVPVVTDSCVPLSEFANVIQATAQDVEEQGVVGPCFGHAGDGNFHCILPITADEDPDYLQRVHAVNDRLIRRTLEAGGTCTGEHGVGYGKTKYLNQQYGPGAVQMMRAIKQALDPRNIMNPGKVVPDE